MNPAEHTRKVLGRTTRTEVRSWWWNMTIGDQEQVIAWLLENPPRGDTPALDHAFRELHQATYRPVKGGPS